MVSSTTLFDDNACKFCKEPAACVGFYFSGNEPDDNKENMDEYHCTRCCDHDRCASIAKRRLERGGH